ncbi:MAG: hypothetical protein JSU85_14545, partial [Candidatus Zixiibacteriota bacterium]
MGRLIKIIVGLLILSVVVFGCGKTSRPDAPDETFYINLTPEDLTADIGDTLILTGAINSVENLFAISFDLVFDTSIVSYLSISIPQTSILGQNSISFSNQIEEGVSISLGKIQSSGNDNISASGPLFVVNFIAVSAGATEIQYRDVYIIDEEGEENAELGEL